MVSPIVLAPKPAPVVQTPPNLSTIVSVKTLQQNTNPFEQDDDEDNDNMDYDDNKNPFKDDYDESKNPFADDP